MTIIDEIFDLFETRGSKSYIGEPVTQSEHALQTAHIARESGASDAMIAAALLHDIGHLLHDEDENAADKGTDTKHEATGNEWLSKRFPPEVTEPVRLHVAAKRYLCTKFEERLLDLSPASQQSFALQGGAMSEAEMEAFEGEAFGDDAILLRAWDDVAKTPWIEVPEFETYRRVMENVLDSTGKGPS